MSKSDNSSSDDPSDDMEGRLARLEERIKNEEKSVQKRVAAYAGLLALLISISTGSISIYNAFFVAPEMKREAHAQRLSSAIQEYSSRFAEVNSLSPSAPPEQRYAAVSGLNVARAALVAEVSTSDWGTLSLLSSPDLSASAWVIAESDEFELSQRLAELAVEKSKRFPEWSTAMNTLARTMLMSDEAEGKKMYEDLFKKIATEKSLWRASSYTSAAITETHVLAVTGRCEEFASRVEKHKAALQEMNVDDNNLGLFTMAVEANKALCRAG